MGFLTIGHTLDWEASKVHISYVKHHGLVQFMNMYNAAKERKTEIFKWGDEVEYQLLVNEGGVTRLCLRGPEILDSLNKLKADIIAQQGAEAWNTAFLPEYGAHMIEATPGTPYGGDTADLIEVEKNMRLRRKTITRVLNSNELLMSITVFPRMGTPHCTSPDYPPNGPVALSQYMPDEIINPHPRFATLTRNIRTRRGSKVNVLMPLFIDTNTRSMLNTLGDAASAAGIRYVSPVTDGKETAQIPMVHADAMCFGMGNCCLQVTFQATSLDEARLLYDHLAVLSPILMALTASTPLFHGYILDSDVRWNTLVQACDCRMPAERGETSLEGVVNGAGVSALRLMKSRYSSIDCFLARDAKFRESYNDVPIAVDEQALTTLIAAGIDPAVAQHVAHLWVRDPLVVYEEKVIIDDSTMIDHFENIQSTNWNNVRFKPPGELCRALVISVLISFLALIRP